MLGRYARKLKEVSNSYLAARAADIVDLEKNLLRHLRSGERREGTLPVDRTSRAGAPISPPSETAGLNREFVLGFATEGGNHESHGDSRQRAQIPAVVGVGPFLGNVSGRDGGDRRELWRSHYRPFVRRPGTVRREPHTQPLVLRSV
ncbi:MAG: hypothetical protein R3B90_04835 [Planctomycetaceae bacterium]